MTTETLYRIFQNHPRIVTDSRKIEKGAIFFALKGERFDGNKFVGDALRKGAALAVTDEPAFHQPGKTLLVADVLQTLQELALFHRKALGIPVLAITGSNGKTTTKELIAAVLSKKFRVTFTEGNFNNHVGLPLTLLRMNEKTDIGVVEMGANHQGEIAQLCSIADPDFGIITNIGRAHLEGFGSLEIIKQTKAELYRYLEKKNGTVFYNRNNPVLSGLLQEISHTVSYGGNGADLPGELLRSVPFIQAKARFPEGDILLKTNLPGDYNFENVMAAACIGSYFGVDPWQIREAINDYRPTNNRSQLIEKNDLKIVMDAYNANPTSMQASIESFVSAFPVPRYLILGDMLELGKESLSEHKAIVEQIKKHPFAEVFLVGPAFSEAAKDASLNTFEAAESLGTYLSEHPIKKGSLLIKGSRGIQLEKVLEFL